MKDLMLEFGINCRNCWYVCIYQDFLDRGLLLTGKLLKQRFLLVKLKSSRRKFCGRHHDKNPLWNVCVTDDNGYVLFVVVTVPYFVLHS